MHPGSSMVELSDAPRFSYGWTHSFLPCFAWLDSQRLPMLGWLEYWRPLGFRMVGLLDALGFRMVGLLGAHWFLYGWTFIGSTVFAKLDS